MKGHPLLSKFLSCAGWLPTYGLQRVLSARRVSGTRHFIFSVADHFEPYIDPARPRVPVSTSEQMQRIRNWCSRYPLVFDSFRDSDGIPFRHTYFYPAECHDKDIVSVMAEHCHAGWGELEIHLHHGIDNPDTAEHLKHVLIGFRDALAQNGCLARIPGSDVPRYAFVHGNWALANSARGKFCGVDSEMQILAETGCYADFTLPSAPSRGQVKKINAIYECFAPLNRRAPHRSGKDLACGCPPKLFPIIVQGPLMLNFMERKFKILPALENSELSAANPPTLNRVKLWERAGIGVRGRPEWVFMKLHCHAMDPRDSQALLSTPMVNFLQSLAELARSRVVKTHFVTAREMTNIILAACDGKSGNPGAFRDYRLRII